jgi:aryl-alcohol dehydrogenase-like predicted oxidoreductase
MDYVPLGRTGLVSSIIGLGGGSSGRFGLVNGGTKSDGLRLIRTALDEGVTFFDGAGICGGVDELLAEGLGSARNDVLVSTKIHLGPDPIPISGSRFANRASSWLARRMGWVTTGSVLRRRVELTLQTLRTDRIDVLHLHAVSPRQYRLAVERAVPELQKLKEEGKVRAIGLTEGFLKDSTHRMLSAAVVDPCVDTIMVGFNPGNFSAADTIIPTAKQQGMGVIGMFALRGLLGSSAADISTLAEVLQEAGIQSLSALAYRYCRHQPGMDIVLTGTSNPRHLRENIASVLAPPLPSAVLERLRAFDPNEAQADDGSTWKRSS